MINCSFNIVKAAASAGAGASSSGIKSPKCESSSSPIGVSNETGSWAIFWISLTFSTGKSITFDISSGNGSLPNSWSNCLCTLISLFIVSTMCTGILIVLAWSAIALVIACLIHHVA